MPVRTNGAAHTAERVTSHDDGGGALDIGSGADLYRHDEISGGAIRRARVFAWLLRAVLALLYLGAKLRVGKKFSRLSFVGRFVHIGTLDEVMGFVVCMVA
jgi:hypothetical protein